MDESILFLSDPRRTRPRAGAVTDRVVVADRDRVAAELDAQSYRAICLDRGRLESRSPTRAGCGGAATGCR